MNNAGSVGAEFIKELKEQLATESKKMKWQRSADAQTYHGGTAYTSKTFILERYLGTDDE